MIAQRVGRMSTALVAGTILFGCVPGATGAFLSPPTVSASDVGAGTPRRERRMGGDISVPYAPNGAELLTFGGDIRVRQAGGFVAASTFGGAIVVDSLASGARLVAHGGDVRVNLMPSTSARDLEITVRGGDVELELSNAASARIEIRMNYGRGDGRSRRIDSAFPLRQSEPSEWRREASHAFQQRQEVEASGTVGSGRDRITIHVDDGSVILRRG